MRITVTKKLIINFFVLSLLPLLAIDTIFYAKAKKALIGRTFEQLTFVRVEKTARVTAFMDQRVHDLINISENKGSINQVNSLYDPPESELAKSREANLFTDFLSAYLRAADCYSSVLFYLPDKAPFSILIDSAHPTDYPQAWLQKQFGRITSNSQYFIQEYSAANADSAIQVLLIKGVYWAEEKIGMVMLTVPISNFSRIMFEDNPLNGLGKTGESYIVGSDFLMRSTSRFAHDAVMQIQVQTTGVMLALEDSAGSGMYKDYRGMRVLGSYGRINLSGLNWAILAEIDANEAMIPIFVLRNSIIYLSIIIAMLLLGIVIFNATWIMLPIKKLKAATDVISKGKYGDKIQLEQQDEIGDLVEAFNLMSQTLQEQSERLEHEKIMRTTSMIDAQEAERQHLSRELHDGLGQLVLAIRMKLNQLTDDNTDKNNLLIAETHDLIRVTVSEIRNISNNLMPSVLHEFGLVAALGKLAREITANGQLVVDFQSNFQEKEFIINRIQIYLYRIVQEALNNVIKHGDATEVVIRLNKSSDGLMLTIKDNGKGFRIEKKSYFSGNGITNMKERANLLGGHFQLNSKVNRGTEIIVDIPI
ncbi:MAG: ATP-binding protein [Bacteroidales bacterium]|nr:ATP-binding protein [Bacteroidales bacterium]